MFGIFLIFLLIGLNHLSLANNDGLEVRTCVCHRLLQLCQDKKSNSCDDKVCEVSLNGEELLPHIDAKDTFTKCDFRPQCDRECEKAVKMRYGVTGLSFTEAARHQICQDKTPRASENGAGYCLDSYGMLSGCGNNKAFIIEKELCCRYCNCKLSYSNLVDADVGKLNEIANYKNEIDANYTYRSFRCSEKDNNRECEKDCRSQTANVLKFPSLNNENQSIFDIISLPHVSDIVCDKLESLGIDKVNWPGFNIYLGMAPADEPKDHLKKELLLGNICCKRPCTCKILLRDSKKKNFIKEFDLTNRLKFHKSYKCNDELKLCLDDCKEVVGDFLNNAEIKDPSSSVLDMNIFYNFRTAFCTCEIISEKYPIPDGVLVYLRYSIANGINGDKNIKKDIYPYTQELPLGRLCCQKFNANEYFPYGKEDCVDWSQGETSHISRKCSYSP